MCIYRYYKFYSLLLLFLLYIDVCVINSSVCAALFSNILMSVYRFLAERVRGYTY